MWNLLSIVREMFKRNDRNSIPLLEIITDECLATEKVRKHCVSVLSVLTYHFLEQFSNDLVPAVCPSLYILW